MNTTTARNLFFEFMQGFFTSHTVIFANQSRMAKPELPLVVIASGNVQRPLAENETFKDGVVLGFYESKITFTIDLFTNGKPVKDNDGQIMYYEDTAEDEMTFFADYINSPKGVAWSSEHDVSLITSDVQDLSGVVNDNNYEYRARTEVTMTYMYQTNPKLGDTGYFQEVKITDEEGE